jgi:hypothetical protein
MSRRKDEEFARLAFERFLSNCGEPNQLWQDGADPPDFEVIINDVIYPVEVAQLMESVASGKRKLPERGWTSTLTKVADRVEAEMKRRGVLRGTYCLHLVPVPEPYCVLNSIFPDIERYLVTTRVKEIAQPHILWRGKDGASWSIEKNGSAQDMVGHTTSISSAKWVPEIEDDLRQILDTELADKRDKTRRMSDVILLFIDAYHYADPPQWCRVASEIDFAPFHTVARVHDDWQCQILHSAQSSWRDAG